jgi:hypothetical protein
LHYQSEARALSRALVSGLPMGAAAAALLGAAYLAGSQQQAATAEAQQLRLSQAAADGFSEAALRLQTAAVAPGALTIAARHDPLAEGSAVVPYAGADGAVRSSINPSIRAAAFSLRGGEPSDPAPVMLHTSLSFNIAPMRPFHFGSGGAAASTRDLECLTDAVYYEARGETPAGQAAVAQVVLNRVRHPAFPKTVCGVVFQGAHTGDTCQFSFACDGSMDRSRDSDAWRRAQKVASRALQGFVMPSVGSATHFHVAGLDPSWGPSLMRVAQIGLHVFYRFGYGGGVHAFDGRPQHSDDAATPPPAAVLANIAQQATAVTADGRPAASPATPAAAPTGAAAKSAGASVQVDAGRDPVAKSDVQSAKPETAASITSSAANS